MSDVFDFGPDKVVERVNLREQVAWCQPAGEEDTLMMAQDALRMGLVKVSESQPLEPFVAEDLSRKILVVGGGLTGMTAALEAARAGYETVLVEKEETLGGYLKDVYRLPPCDPPYESLEDFNLEEMSSQLAGTPGVTIYTGAMVGSVSGAPCLFDVEIRQNGATKNERVGAIILATGSVPYDAAKLSNLSYGTTPDVITARDLEAMFKGG
jgi:quinone-modifying oxidoreductase subunit QmoB